MLDGDVPDEVVASVSEVFVARGEPDRARSVLEEALERYHLKGIVAYDDDVAARLAQLD